MNQQHLLLDIEGTTCPVSFVSDVLFPFAKQELSHYIKQHWDKIPHNKLIQAAKEEWLNDQSPESMQIKQQVSNQETEEMDGLIQWARQSHPFWKHRPTGFWWPGTAFTRGELTWMRANDTWKSWNFS